MSQLRMFNDDLKQVNVFLKPGFSIINSLDTSYSPDEYAVQWAEICTELNQEFNPALYQKLMIDDEKVLRDSVFFVRDSEGKLISTAALRQSNFHDVMGLHMVGTRINSKGMGAGKAVCSYSVNEAYKKGYRKMLLATDEFRIPAIKIYYGLGFLPDLYEDDMRERWIGVAKEIGLKELKTINENREHEIIKLND